MVDAKILVTGDFNIPSSFNGWDVDHLRVPKSNLEITDRLKHASHYIIGGPEYCSDDMMKLAPNLRHIIVMGTGTNSFVDLEAAKSRGIIVDNTPKVNANSVAEFAVGMIITNLADSFNSRAKLLAGEWLQTPHKTLSECKIGIFGLGEIGSKIATKLNAISSCEISYFSRSRKNSLEQSQGLKFSNLKSIFEDCDLVVSSVNYNDNSHHIINSSIFQGANNKLVFLNFSNPKIVNPQDLKQALVNNQIKMAYFDGYYDEWIENRGEKYDRHGLLKLGPEKFIATSHIAAQSNSAIQSILAMALEHIQTRLESPDTPNFRPS